jgi:branched-chain amino acid transport system substrate-binding protein
MRKRVLAVTMMLALAASALAGGTASAETEYKGTIKLGGLAPLTGNYAEYGKGFEIGFNKAIEEIN